MRKKIDDIVIDFSAENKIVKRTDFNQRPENWVEMVDLCKYERFAKVY
jgi:hypothetical protein